MSLKKSCDFFRFLLRRNSTKIKPITWQRENLCLESKSSCCLDSFFVSPLYVESPYDEVGSVSQYQNNNPNCDLYGNYVVSIIAGLFQNLSMFKISKSFSAITGFIWGSIRSNKYISSFRVNYIICLLCTKTGRQRFSIKSIGTWFGLILHDKKPIMVRIQIFFFFSCA